MDDMEIKLLDWPAKSPDLSPIENVWGTLVREVYAGGRQFESLAELRAQVERSWEAVAATSLQKLYDDVSRRMVEVLYKKGGAIDR